MNGASYHSKMEVGRAGKALVAPLASNQEREAAIEVANYWREIHGEVLQRALEDIEGLSGFDDDVLVAGRIKKFDTIVDKLNRPKTPSDLQTMYDIAGCRLVVPDLRQLEKFCSSFSALACYDSQKTARHDYLARPRPSGYRGRHVVLHYDDLSCGHKLFVEVQVRTQLQHDWATAVEMHDEAVKSRLKFNEIDNPAGRFFRKAALVIEQIERKGRVRASEIRDAIGEREELPRAFEVIEVLKAACNASTVLGEAPSAESDGYCLVDFLPDVQALSLSPLAIEAAMPEYFRREQQDEAGEHNLVLVKGATPDRLARLYPNYFGDISSFVSLVDKYMDAFA